MSDETVVEEPGESAAPTEKIEAPDHTPETEADPEAVVEADAETPAADEAEESVDETEASPDDKEVDFSDLDDNFIPPPEQIDKLRIPKEERETYKKVAALADSAVKQLDEVGGDFGVKAFAPFAKILTKASATDEELGAVAAALDEANPHVSMQLATGYSQFMLSNEQFADPLLKSMFGENASLTNIKSLLALDKEGLVDKDENLFGGNPSEFFDLKKENEELKLKLESGKVPEPDKRGVRASQDFETDFYGEIPLALKATFEKAGWQADDDITKLVTEVLFSRLKVDPKYKNTEEFLKSTGLYRNGEKRVGMADANIHLLKNQAIGQGRELVRLIQAAFRQQSDRSRNRIIAEKQKDKEQPKTTAPVSLPAPNESFETRQERLREQYKQAIA